MMELVRRIEKNELLTNEWGIYKLSQPMQEKYNKKYALTQGILADDVGEYFDEDSIIHDLRTWNYEGTFDTELEAFYQVKLIEMENKINALTKVISLLDNAITVGKSTIDIATPVWHKAYIPNNIN